MAAVPDLGVIAFMFEMLDEEDEAMEIELKYLTSYSNFNEQKNGGKRDTVPKVRVYEDVLDEIRVYTNICDFKTHYRIDLEMFDIILRELHPILEHHNIGGSMPHPEKQLLVFLNFMGNQQSMRECAHFFGMSISTIHGVINRTTEAVLQLQHKVIQWPSPEKQRQTAREVQGKCGLSGAIGFIDGTHIRLASAPGGDIDYYNRKGYPSMQ